MLAAEFGTGQVFLSMLYFFLFFILIWLVIAIFVDIFRSPDLSGWAKALWVLFVIGAAVHRGAHLLDRPGKQGA
jgi:hypothetical protein